MAACVTRPTTLGAIESESQGSAGEGDEGEESASDSMSGPGTTGAETGSEDESETGPPTDCILDAEAGTATLTARQYENAFRDIFGSDVTVDRREGRFAGVRTGVDRDEYAEVAAEVAAQMNTSIFSCLDGPECALDFVEVFMPQAWRGGVPQADVAAILEVFNQAGDMDSGMRDAAAVVLADPRFYEVSLEGTPVPGQPGLIQLDARSVGTRLALFVTNSIPDAELLDAMEDESVLYELEDHLNRLLAHPRAKDAVDDLYSSVLGTRELADETKSMEVTPPWGPELAAAAVTEQRLFLGELFFGGAEEPTLENLFTATHTYANDILAENYGSDLPGGPPGADFERVELDPARRPGVLTRTAFLTAHSGSSDWVTPPRRGIPMLELFGCGAIPPPPPDNVDQPPFPDPGHGPWDLVLDEPACQGCHALFDGYGFALDNYDVVGRWRPDGEPYGSDALDGYEFDDLNDLLGQVLAGDAIAECFVDRYYAAAVRRDIGERDICATDQFLIAFEDSGRDLMELTRTIALSPAFRLGRT